MEKLGKLVDKLPEEDRRPLMQRLPRRNLRRALFLVIALLAVVALKRSGGLSFGDLFNTVAPAQPGPAYRLHVEPPAQR